jgi:hypothetical protein
VSGDVYAHAKLLNVLSSLALAWRLPPEQVTVNLVHPGMAWTPTQSMTSETIPAFRLVWPLLRAGQRRRSPERAGQRVALVASARQLSGHTGQYFEAKPTPGASRLGSSTVSFRSGPGSWGPRWWLAPPPGCRSGSGRMGSGADSG